MYIWEPLIESWQKYVTKILCIYDYFQEKHWECLKVQLSAFMCLRIFYQVKELINCKCSIRTTSKKLFLENYALAYHTADKDHACILWIVFPIFFVCFVCLISIEIIKIKRIPMKEIGYNFIYSIDQKVSPACQPDFLKLWRVCILLYKNQEILA